MTKKKEPDPVREKIFNDARAILKEKYQLDEAEANAWLRDKGMRSRLNILETAKGLIFRYKDAD